MMLRKRMAEFGFESNEDYDFALRALFAARNQHLRCLNVAGESGRRKTAFANALAHALDYKRILYHDFSTPEPPPAPIVITEDDKSNPSPADAPLSAYERVVVEACAYTEGEPTVLILDQLQLAEFREQIRLYHFIHSGEWSLGSASVRANPKHMVVMLISESPLYHSLAKVSYRVWTEASGGRFEFRPQDFQLGVEAQVLFDSLARLFEALVSVPTPTEFGHILDDLLQHVRTEEQLRCTLFGWMEHIDRDTLYAPALLPALRESVEALNQMLGLEEVVLGDEVSSRAVE